jgi:hypothetical protein
MALPGTVLGFSNLLAISTHHGLGSLPAAWIQGHGHAQVFGWIGSFILGIGFYSQPSHGRSILRISLACFALWTSGVGLRWAANIYGWHWRILFPLSAGFEVIAVLLFLAAASHHKLPEPIQNKKTKPAMELWMVSVLLGTAGLTALVIFNFVECLALAMHGTLLAFPHALDQKYLVLLAWGFLVPVVWGFSARWLPAFLSIARPDARWFQAALIARHDQVFLVVIILWGVQILMGVLTAHYGVEGHGFYGFPLDRYLPYAVTRTWHLQLAIFWIATSWLATGLYVGPAVSGHEPKYQRLGVNVLFGALILVVGGSLAGEWMGIQQRLGNMWFWFGSQGYEYVDLGRFWQILLFIGLVLWLVLMVATLKPALVRKSEDQTLLILFLISSIAIPLFYAAGLMYGQRSNLVTAEYWRWWVVHLWVEGFFEVFATVVIGFLFARLQLIEIRTATKAALFSTTIFLSGGIIGTFHHLYFAGATPAVIGLGAIFSAFEVVPLALIGYEAWDNLRIAQPTKKAPWIANYKWPIYFFVAVAFWNMVGAGLFGFLINPPISLYYVQGLNLTPLHGHTALFGVYGMLGLGLTLFCLRALSPERSWKQGALKLSFWSLNVGLTLMSLLSLLPVGLLQAWASIQYGTWYARSAEFMQSGTMQTLRWMRVPGDIVLSIGAAAFAWFVLGLLTGHSYADGKPAGQNAALRSSTEQNEAALTGR